MTRRAIFAALLTLLAPSAAPAQDSKPKAPDTTNPADKPAEDPKPKPKATKPAKPVDDQAKAPRSYPVAKGFGHDGMDNPAFKLRVIVDPQLAKRDVPARKEHQEMASVLTAARISTPIDRLNYFLNRPTHRKLHFTGWYAIIQEIRPRKGGGHVVVLSVRSDYDGVYDSNEIHERYSVVDGKVKYLGCKIPESQYKYPWISVN